MRHRLSHENLIDFFRFFKKAIKPKKSDIYTRKLNWDLQMKPDLPIPKGYTREKKYKIENEYRLPKRIQISEATRICFEIVDSLLADSLSVHVIEPILKKSKITIAVKKTRFLAQKHKLSPIRPKRRVS